MDPCDYCGNDPDECVCYLAPDFPDEPIPELDTDYLNWDHYEEEKNDEGIR
jgi:hypothetical protein